MDEQVRAYSYRGPVSPSSPAAQVFSDALDLAMEDKSPFPDRSTFIDADSPKLSRAIEAANEDGQFAVVVSPDGSTRVISPRGTSGGAETQAGA